MATYKGIKGVKVVTKATDPSASEAEATVWYNSTSPSALKYAIQGTAAWAASVALPTATNNGAGFGIVTAAMNAAGYTPGGATTNCQTFNGTAWTEVGNTTEAAPHYGRRGAGTLTAGVIWGGTTQTVDTENWNGTSWSASGHMANGRHNSASLGIQTAAISAAGYTDPATSADTEIYNGSTWTTGNNVQTARQGAAGAGITTAALIFGGNEVLSASETYDGTCWATTNSLNTGRSSATGTGDSVPVALCWGGANVSWAGIANTEKYDGTSWAEVADLATARGDGQEAGTGKASALCIGGEPPRTTAVEEWADPVYTIKTVTVS